MSDNGSNGPAVAHRRSSITQAALSNLFQRNPSNGNGSLSGTGNGAADPRGRRLSVTTIGLSGTSPTTPATFGMRRGSMSTNSSIDESAIDDDDGQAKSGPGTPFVRRMSFGASGSGATNNNNSNSNMRGYRPNGSPGNDQQGFNWSEQLRSRAESSVSAASRQSFSFGSPPRAGPAAHDRTRSVSDMPQPPAQTPTVQQQQQQQQQQQPRQEKPKPDAFQERILKGDFYMD